MTDASEVRAKIDRMFEKPTHPDQSLAPIIKKKTKELYHFDGAKVDLPL